ncbi:MAG: alpha-N-arabinofuranosidase [Candidatus Solibacter sp.]
MPGKLFASILVGILPIAAVHAQTRPAAPPQRLAPATVAVSIDVTKTAPPINPYLYGQFIEHIGDLVNHGMWAEQLDDRKFYYEINSKPAAQPAGRGGGGGGGRGGRPTAQWRPIGPDEAVVMDKVKPYVGKQSPKITLAGAEARGIRQSGVAVRKGKAYTGRVILNAAPGAKITVSLVWGTGPADRQTLPVAGVTAAWAKYPLKFMAGADNNAATLEIAGTGQGSFHVGAVSLMPADNIKGWRPEVIALLKAQRSGMWRWPGGNYLSAHEWRDAIGDPDKRPPKPDVVRTGAQPNDVGTDEFMTMCELLGVDPFISVSSGFGDAWSAAQLVEYANGAATTPMGKLRAANGHPAPYKIKWWGIGNEMYGPWQYGVMPLNQYVFKHNMFGEAMREVDPSITLLATGATPEEMTIYGVALPVVGKLIPDYGSAGDWDYGLLTKSLDFIDVMSEHFYSYAGQRMDHEKPATPGHFNRNDYMVRVDEPLVEWARRPANRVRNKIEAYEEYARRIPALQAKKVPMVIDEWAYSGSGNNMKSALANAMVMQEMFRHSGLIIMAGHTMGTGSIDVNANEAALNTTGMFFKLYRDHFGTVPVEVGGNSPVPAPLYPVGADQPKINAGSPTFPVDVVAALSADGKSLTVAVINANEAAQQMTLNVKGATLGKGRVWTMTADKLEAVTGLGRNEVKITETPMNEAPSSLTVAPISISIYEFSKP